MKIGYARISKNHPDASDQLDALKQAGCQLTFIDRSSSVRKANPGLETALNHMQAGDTLLIWRLECLGRSLKHLIDTVNLLAEREIGFQSLQEPIDTTTAEGQRVFDIFAALAEFQRNIIREQTKAGLQRARARGRNGGRPKALDAEKMEVLYNLYDQKQHSIQEICTKMGISKSTLYAYLKERQET